MPVEDPQACYPLADRPVENRQPRSGKENIASSDSPGHNLVPRSHSVTGNVRSGKVRQYTNFHWPLKKGCGNAINAPIGLFRGARNECLVFASSCAVLNKYQLCGGKFCFFRRRKSFTVKENHFKNLRRLCKWYRRKLHVPCHSNKVLRSLLRGTQKLINSS